jgi:hypothetical protein
MRVANQMRWRIVLGVCLEAEKTIRSRASKQPSPRE